MMKAVKILSLTIATVALSCSSEEPPPAETFSKDQFVGSWQADGGFLAMGFWTFESDGEYTQASNLEPDSQQGTWRVEKGVLIRELPDGDTWETPIVEVGEDFFKVQLEPGDIKQYTRMRPANTVSVDELMSLDCGFATEFAL